MIETEFVEKMCNLQKVLDSYEIFLENMGWENEGYAKWI